MKRNYCLSFVFFAVLGLSISSPANAVGNSDILASQSTQQIKKISGTIVDSKGEPIIGASVLVKGTGSGTITDIDGKFTLNASQGAVLAISYVGYVGKNVTVGSSAVYSIVLVDDTQALSEVVVTAMGIKKEKKALGYAVQDIKSGELMKNKTANVINSLSGKIAGVNVTQGGGAAGAGAQIIIRGGTSLERDNQPLFVVDGIVYDNGVDIGGNSSFDGAQSTNSSYSNRVMDINPEDVENMSVLKGPAAAALYGSRASSGVIIITTKKGKEGNVEVNLSSKLSTTWVNRLPEQQNKYKRGSITENGILTDESILSSWGEAFGSGDTMYNNIENFFKSSMTLDNNISISGGTKNSNFFLSLSRFDQDGIIPETGYIKNTVRFNGEQKYGKLTIGANMAYSIANSDKSLTSGGLYNSGGTGAMNSVFRWPRNEDMSHWKNEDGSKYRMFDYQLLASDIDNPYWIVNRNRVTDETTRFTGNLNFKFDVTDWFKINYTGGIDNYTTNTQRLIEAGSGVVEMYQDGMLSQSDRTYEYLMSNLMLSFNKKIGDFDFNFLAGNSIEDTKITTNRRKVWNFITPEFYSINNTAEADRSINQSNIRKRLIGLYGEFRVGYKSLAYLTVTERNDNTSTLPRKNRSYFYPSISGVLVFSELLPNNNIFSFGKVRASWARVGKDADAYVTNTYAESELTIGGVGVRNSWTRGNPYLIPETTESSELGLDMRFLNGRVGFDFTYYSNKSYNQLLSPRTSQATGYIFMTTNAGNITNKGMELSITGTPVKTRDFTWESTINLSGNRGKVNDLLAGLDVLYVTDVQVGNAKAASFNGGNFMAISGSQYARDNSGNVILDAKTGMPTYDGLTTHEIGNREPKLLAGFNNSLQYKNWNLSFLFDFRLGGDIYNGTDYFMTGEGMSKRSQNRENLAINGVVSNGKDADGNAIYTSAAYQFSAGKFYNKDNYTQEVAAGTANSVSGEYIIRNYYTTYYSYESANYMTNTNWIRLRSVSLSYRLPKHLLLKSKFVKDLTLTATGTNLLLITNYKGMDPETSAAGAGAVGSSSVGIDYCGVPATAGCSFGVNVTF
ncbi:MAG: TonB-linked outer membrane protein, SusC/RagA family [Bacteroidetes bacterium]|nr:TonB-linked outer membrane protein, SusC/RagA family [Bacteroidota bacterium]